MEKALVEFLEKQISIQKDELAQSLKRSREKLETLKIELQKLESRFESTKKAFINFEKKSKLFEEKIDKLLLCRR